jgi:O-antigen/teichoic acid export membrane protein
MSEPAAPEELSVAKQRRMKDIVASTLLVGGGSIVNIACTIARSKVISIVAGPAGIGLQGLLQSTMRTMISVANLSLQTTGVREVARLRADNDKEELGHTLRALGLTTLVLGAIGTLALVLFQGPLSRAILDAPALSWTLAVIGIGVFSQVLYATYDAFLRGFRRIALQTKASVVANVLAAIVASVLVWQFGVAAVPFSIVAQPLFLLLSAAYVARDLREHLVPPNRERTRSALKRILGTGLVLAITALLVPGVQLVARVIIGRWASLDEVGYYQAASAVSLLYLGFVLGAMSLDYYPRLAEAASDHAELRRMVNEQARVSLLMAGPVVLGMIALSDQVVAMLYTSEFAITSDILRWQLLGDVVKIGSWTLGYLVLAQGKPRVYFVTELTWAASYVIVLVVLLPSLGLYATPVAYIASSVVYFVTLCFVTNRMVGFAWSRGNVVLMVALAALGLGVLGAHELLEAPWGWLVGVAITAFFGVACLHRLVQEVGFSKLLRRGKRTSVK